MLQKKAPTIQRLAAAAMIGLGAVGLASAVARAQQCGPNAACAAPTSATKTFENAQLRYSVALPAGCRHEEGPGTLDAVCSPELDPEKSALASAAGSLVLEVGTEAVPDDAGKPVAALAQGFGEARFKEELGEAVCGEPDKARVKVENVKQVLEETRVVYTAGVTCPEIRVLALGERRATASLLVTPGMRYRLMARAPTEEFEQHKAAIDAFFASFRVLPAEKAQ
jgi:hypothetical protein